MSCAICHIRKEKRFCPGIHGRICPQCCGEQREVTIDCPGDCPYLLQARAHEKPRDFSDIDQAEFFPNVEISDQFTYEREHLLFGLTFALARRARSSRTLVDRDLIAAVVSLAKAHETLVNSGLIYEQPTANLEHQAITAEIEQMVKEFRESERKHMGATLLRDSEVLKALVFLSRLGLARTSGRPKSRAFIAFLLEKFPEDPSPIAAPEDMGSRIIVP